MDISHSIHSLTRKTVQKCIDPATLPANRAHTSTMEQLRNKWQCNDKSCRSGSEYCYVGGESALSHAHIDVWAAAIVKFIFLLL
jgi:hypothetical protein